MGWLGGGLINGDGVAISGGLESWFVLDPLILFKVAMTALLLAD